jgi:hypothetical protein
MQHVQHRRKTAVFCATFDATSMQLDYSFRMQHLQFEKARISAGVALSGPEGGVRLHWECNQDNSCFTMA